MPLPAGTYGSGLYGRGPYGGEATKPCVRVPVFAVPIIGQLDVRVPMVAALDVRVPVVTSQIEVCED